MFDITLDNNFTEPYSDANTTIAIVPNTGENFRKGSTVKIPGTQLGGTSPANDLVIKLDQVDGYGDLYIYNMKLLQRTMSAQAVKQ